MRTIWLAAAMWLAACLPGTILVAGAQELSGPSEVVLYIHSEMKRADFVEHLECALKHVLVAPVSTQDLKLALGRDLLASPTQLDVQKVANAFAKATANEGGPRTFKYLFLPFDLKDAEHRYVFATSFSNAQLSSGIGIMSTARLDTRNPKYPNEQNSAQTAHRLYKLVLKSVARLAGLKSPDACVLVFPHSLEELDRKSAEFCPDDRATLVKAGILKAVEDVGNGCGLVASRKRDNWLANLTEGADPYLRTSKP